MSISNALCPTFSANETISVLDLYDRVFAMTDYC